MKTLILGGARSGKSRHAQELVESFSPSRVFIATAEALDSEMSDRIARHVSDRGDTWETIEAPLQLCEAISLACNKQKAVLVDCLTLWLSNVMHAGHEVEVEVRNLADTVEAVTSPLILVSNEVGMGIVPESPLGREFRDAQGRLNQAIATACDRVELVAAGLPLKLKG